MSLESPDNEKNFPGLYKQSSLSEPVTEEDGERGGLGKKRDTSRKRDGKKDKKEKGYTMFEEEESEEELVAPEDVKSPTKAKKVKAGFKFPAKKDIFPRMKEKDEKKDKEAKKEEKEKKKEEKEVKKHKIKEKKKPKLSHIEIKPAVTTNACENPIFGIPLALAVERNRSHDGIQLPAIVRECIDYVEECGLTCEGIYRISGVKSKVQHLKDCYNKGIPVDLVEHEPNVVASLLKQFLRELPEPVLTTVLMPKFEEASTIKNDHKKVETFIRLIEDLPTCNRLLLSWMIVHMTHIIELQKENKMSLQNVSIVLSPTMQISHRVLNVLFTFAHQIFKDTYLKKYVPPLKPATSRWSLELPDSTGALEEEVAKQESLLNQLHARLNAGHGDLSTEEQLWEVQRVVTQLKRKIKLAKKSQGTVDRRRKDMEQKRSSQLSETEELQLELRTAPSPVPTTMVAVEHHKEPKRSKTQEARETQGQGDVKKDDMKIEPHENSSESGRGIETPGDISAQADAEESPAQVPAVEEKPKVGKNKEKEEKRGSRDLQKSEKRQSREMGSEGISKQQESRAEEVKAAEVKAAEVKAEKPECPEGEVEQSGNGDTQPDLAEKPESRPEEEVAKACPVAEQAQKHGEDGAELSEQEPAREESEVKQEPSHLSGEEGDVGRMADLEEEETEKIPTAKMLDTMKGGGEMGTVDGKEPQEAEVSAPNAQEKAEPAIVVEKTQAAATAVQEKTQPAATAVQEKAQPVAQQKTQPAATAVQEKTQPPAAGGQVEEREVKPRGPVQVHPHLYLTLEPLQPIKAQPLKPRRDRVEKALEESQHKSAKLRELEEELLGVGYKEGEKVEKEQRDAEKTEPGDEEYDSDATQDEELERLIEEEFALRLEEEELLAIGDELRKKIETEESEIERLQQEIQELQYLRHDSDLEDMSSGSDSSYESEDEEDLQDMLSTLIHDNLQLEQENADLCQKIHEERMICLSVKLQIRLLQQKQLESSQSSILIES